MVQAPSKGWDTFPPKEDTTMGANLYRIKALRNRLAHLPKTKIKNKNYKHMSTMLRKVQFSSFIHFSSCILYKIGTVYNDNSLFS